MAKGLLLVTLAYSSSRLPLSMRFSSHLRLTSPLRYFSITKLAMGAAQRAPQYPFSTITARAILGLSFGAKAIKTE